jgi:hypothetical protein
LRDRAAGRRRHERATDGRETAWGTVIAAATWTTLRPEGFTDAQIAGIETIVAPLARITEVYALRRTASNLLDAYVGHQAGERILGGRIRGEPRPGCGSTLRADYGSMGDREAVPIGLGRSAHNVITGTRR